MRGPVLATLPDQLQLRLVTRIQQLHEVHEAYDAGMDWWPPVWEPESSQSVHERQAASRRERVDEIYRLLSEQRPTWTAQSAPDAYDGTVWLLAALPGVPDAELLLLDPTDAWDAPSDLAWNPHADGEDRHVILASPTLLDRRGVDWLNVHLSDRDTSMFLRLGPVARVGPDGSITSSFELEELESSSTDDNEGDLRNIQPPIPASSWPAGFDAWIDRQVEDYNCYFPFVSACDVPSRWPALWDRIVDAWLADPDARASSTMYPRQAPVPAVSYGGRDCRTAVTEYLAVAIWQRTRQRRGWDIWGPRDCPVCGERYDPADVGRRHPDPGLRRTRGMPQVHLWAARLWTNRKQTSGPTSE